jgi:hypothetical protein
MKIPPIIYKQFRRYKPVNEMRNSQWFALKPGYGTSYGDINKQYRFKKEPKLLDVGNADVRQMIEETIEPHDKSILIYSDPDMQYSGGAANKKYHDLVQQYFGDEYDGTFIDETDLKGNAKYSEDDLSGPSEIVIWKDYDDLLEEIGPSGGKKHRKTHKKRNMKKKRTYRRRH